MATEYEQRSRNNLRDTFANGERPSAKHFAELFESFLNKEDDGVTYSDNILKLSGSLQLGNNPNPVAPAGTLRFEGSKVQFHDGENWVDIAASASTFQRVGETNDIAYTAGKVAIGTLRTPAAHRLEVELDDSADPLERARFGSVICSNGAGGYSSYANFSHKGHCSNSNFALSQGPLGDVRLNSPRTQPIMFSQDGLYVRLLITGGSTGGGHVIVGDKDISPDSSYVFQVKGAAYKSEGGASWNSPSDLRLKEDVQDLEAGLAQLMQVRPVRFRFNGKAGTRKGEEGVGVIGQEIEKVFPEMIQKIDSGAKYGIDDLRVYNGSALTYVLINAVKELATELDSLKKNLPGSKANIPADLPNQKEAV